MEFSFSVFSKAPFQKVTGGKVHVQMGHGANLRLLIKPQSLEVCVAVAPDLTFGQLLWSPSVTVELLLHWLHVR